MYTRRDELVRQLSRRVGRLGGMRTILVMALLLAACGSPGTSVEPTPGRSADPAGAWQLTSATVDGRPLELLDEHPVTAMIDGSSIGGRSACNEYGARIEIAPDGIAIGELGGTLMACGPDAVMALEAAYLAALRRVGALETVGDELVLRGPDVELRFARLPEPPTADLVDTEWILETVVAGEVASPPAGEPATLRLRSDGTLSGSTGCRAFEGRWLERGAEILANELFMDGTECPLELSAQDAHVVSVIGDGFVPSVDGDRLTLTDPGGDGLVYRAGE